MSPAVSFYSVAGFNPPVSPVLPQCLPNEKVLLPAETVALQEAAGVAYEKIHSSAEPVALNLWDLVNRKCTFPSSQLLNENLHNNAHSILKPIKNREGLIPDISPERFSGVLYLSNLFEAFEVVDGGKGLFAGAILALDRFMPSSYHERPAATGTVRELIPFTELYPWVNAGLNAHPKGLPPVADNEQPSVQMPTKDWNILRRISSELADFSLTKPDGNFRRIFLYGFDKDFTLPYPHMTSTQSTVKESRARDLILDVFPTPDQRDFSTIRIGVKSALDSKDIRDRIAKERLTASLYGLLWWFGQLSEEDIQRLQVRPEPILKIPQEVIRQMNLSDAMWGPPGCGLRSEGYVDDDVD